MRRAVRFHLLLQPIAQSGPFLGFSLLHTIEFLGLVYVAVFFTGYIWMTAIFLGLVLHFLLDLIDLYRLGILFKRAHSVLEYLIRWNLMKKRGQKPESSYLAVLKTLAVPNRSMSPNVPDSSASTGRQAGQGR